MSLAARNYAQTARSAMQPRDLEASALLKAAAQLAAAASDMANRQAFDNALTHNRRLWTLFAGAVTDPASPLPEQIRQSIARLADFVFNLSIQALAEPGPEKVAPLIRINRELAAGLRRAEQPGARSLE